MTYLWKWTVFTCVISSGLHFAHKFLKILLQILFRLKPIKYNRINIFICTVKE